MATAGLCRDGAEEIGKNDDTIREPGATEVFGKWGIFE